MRLSDQAAASLHLENAGAPLQVSSLSTLAGLTDLTSVQNAIASRLHHLPLYRKRLAFVPLNLAQPEWVDDAEFTIGTHVTTETLATETEQGLVDRAVAISARPLDLSKPLWRMHLVVAPKLQQTILIHTVHLATLDSATFGEDARVFFDLQKTAKPRVARAWQATPAPSVVELATRAVLDNTKHFASQTERLRNLPKSGTDMMRRATESVSRFLTAPICAAPWNLGFAGGQRHYAQSTMPYLKIRQIRRTLGGTDNDVVLTILFEAAARYLQIKGIVQNRLHLRIFCPVKVRRQDQSGVRGNRMSGVFPVVEASSKSAVERHSEVRRETATIKQNQEAQALQLLSEISPPLPAVPNGENPANGLFKQTPLNWLTFNPIEFFQQFMPGSSPFTSSAPGLPAYLGGRIAGFNFTLVTAHGAQIPLFFDGLEVTAQRLVPALAGNLGFGAAATTYAQSITFNLVADPTLLPDLDIMRSLIDEVVDELSTRAASTRN